MIPTRNSIRSSGDVVALRSAIPRWTYRIPHRVNKRSGTRSASRRGGLDDAAGVQKSFKSLTRGDGVSGVRRPFEEGRLHRILCVLAIGRSERRAGQKSLPGRTAGQLARQNHEYVYVCGKITRWLPTDLVSVITFGEFGLGDPCLVLRWRGCGRLGNRCRKGNLGSGS